MPQTEKQEKGKQRFCVIIDPALCGHYKVIEDALMESGFVIDQVQEVELTTEQIDKFIPREYLTNPVSSRLFEEMFKGKKSGRIELTVPVGCKTKISQILPPSTYKECRGFISESDLLVAHFGNSINGSVFYQPIE